MIPTNSCLLISGSTVRARVRPPSKSMTYVKLAICCFPENSIGKHMGSNGGFCAPGAVLLVDCFQFGLSGSLARAPATYAPGDRARKPLPSCHGLRKLF